MESVDKILCLIQGIIFFIIGGIALSSNIFFLILGPIRWEMEVIFIPFSFVISCFGIQWIIEGIRGKDGE